MPIAASRPSTSRTRTLLSERKRALIVLACVLPVVLWFYWWTATSSISLYAGDFYNRLTDAFLAGQLHLLEKPRPELLALPDPRDPAQNGPYRLHDAVFFRDRYYVYHGPTPALTLFLPFRVLTGGHLAENRGAVTFAAVGFVCSALLWLELCSLLRLRLPVAWIAAGMIAIGFCQSVPFILRRAVFYEVAIAAGYCFLMAAFYTLLLALRSCAPALFLASGVLFGVACGARPHMIFPAAVAFLLVVFYPATARTVKVVEAVSFALPLAISCGLLGFYNYLRFGNPLEFGVSYILAGASYTQGLHLSATNLVPGLYYMLLHPPVFRSEFPFTYIGGRPWLHVFLPPTYFQEGVAGILTLFPPAVLAFIAPFLVQGTKRILLLAILLSAAAVVLFIALTGWSTQRYEVDFVPLLLVAALTAMAILRESARTGIRLLLGVVLVASVAYSTFANAGLSITGQTDTLKRSNPEAFRRIYTFFHRPPGLIMDPGFYVKAELSFPRQPAGTRQPLLTSGKGALAHLVYAEYMGPATMRLVSRGSSDPGESSAEFSYVPDQTYRFTLGYDPSARLLRVHREGQMILAHAFLLLPTTPEAVKVGQNDVAGDVTPAKFTGTFRVLSRQVY